MKYTAVSFKIKTEHGMVVAETKTGSLAGLNENEKSEARRAAARLAATIAALLTLHSVDYQ